MVDTTIRTKGADLNRNDSRPGVFAQSFGAGGLKRDETRCLLGRPPPRPDRPQPSFRRLLTGKFMAGCPVAALAGHLPSGPAGVAAVGAKSLGAP